MSDQDYHIQSEPDSTDKGSGTVIIAFAVCGALLYLTILALDIMYRFQTDWENENKIGQQVTVEAQEYKAQSNAMAAGQLGIFPEKKFIDIERAKRQFLSEYRR